jgi:hypothetical protein
MTKQTHWFNYAFHPHHAGKEQDKHDEQHGKPVNIIKALTANWPPEVVGEQDNCNHCPLFWVMTEDGAVFDAFRDELEPLRGAL